jgi:hypothetical protein
MTKWRGRRLRRLYALFDKLDNGLIQSLLEIIRLLLWRHGMLQRALGNAYK